MAHSSFLSNCPAASAHLSYYSLILANQYQRPRLQRIGFVIIPDIHGSPSKNPISAPSILLNQVSSNRVLISNFDLLVAATTQNIFRPGELCSFIGSRKLNLIYEFVFAEISKPFFSIYRPKSHQLLPIFIFW